MKFIFFVRSQNHVSIICQGLYNTYGPAVTLNLHPHKICSPGSTHQFFDSLSLHVCTLHCVLLLVASWRAQLGCNFVLSVSISVVEPLAMLGRLPMYLQKIWPYFSSFTCISFPRGPYLFNNWIPGPTLGGSKSAVIGPAMQLDSLLLEASPLVWVLYHPRIIYDNNIIIIII